MINPRHVTVSAVDYIPEPPPILRGPCLICGVMDTLAVKIPLRLTDRPGYLCWGHYEEALWRGVREIEADSEG